MAGPVIHSLFPIDEKLDSRNGSTITVDLKMNTTIDEKLDSRNETSDISSCHEDIVAEMHPIEISLMNGATLATNSSELSTSGRAASTAVGDSRESGSLLLSSRPLTSSESDVLAFTLKRTSEMQLESCGCETGVDHKNPMLTIETKPFAPSFPPHNIQSRVTEFAKPDRELITEVEESTPNLIHKDSQREDLYTFYEAPMAKLNGIGALSSGISLHENGNSLLLKGPDVDGAKFLGSQLSHHAGCAVELLP